MNALSKRILLFFLVSTFGACAVVTASNGSQSARTAVNELAWVDSGFGPEVSPVSGDFSSTEHVTFVKFKAGMVTPLHTHSADYVGVMMSGVSKHWEPGKPETQKTLSAGSHWSIPKDVPHVSECLDGIDCLMAIYQKQPMDFLPEP